MVSAVLIIPTWLGSPGHFWPIAYAASLSTFVGAIVLVIDLTIHLVKDGPVEDFKIESFEQFASAFGAILYSFSGGIVFPTIQNDMKVKEDFSKSVVIGFISKLIYK